MKLTMEAKNGIIIDGVLHEAEKVYNGHSDCSNCSLRCECDELEERCGEWICNLIDCRYFVNRGKVTVTPYREIPKNVGEIIKISKEE